jgi:hypothetical protein
MHRGLNHSGFVFTRPTIAERVTTLRVNFLDSAPVANCVSHPDRPARASCQRCGDYLCADCVLPGGACAACDAVLLTLPFQERGERGLLSAWMQTIRLSVTDPRRYARAIAHRVRPGEAFWFGSLCMAVSSFLIMLLAGPLLALLFANLPAQEGQAPSQWWLGLIVALVYGGLAQASFTFGALAWALVLRVSAAAFGFSTRVRPLLTIVLYSSAPLVIAWLPLVGLVASLYSVVLTVMALHESDRTKSLLRASMVALVPLVASFLTFAVGYGVFLFWMLRNVKPA